MSDDIIKLTGLSELDRQRLLQADKVVIQSDNGYWRADGFGAR